MTVSVLVADVEWVDRRGAALVFAHASPFAGTQEQLDELATDTDTRAGARAHTELTRYLRKAHTTAPSSIYDHHRPATRRLTAVLHLGLIPLPWVITTCQCGHRWPCNDIKQHLRHRHGWTTDITTHLKAITKHLPKPRLRLTLRKPATRSTPGQPAGLTVRRQRRAGPGAA